MAHGHAQHPSHDWDGRERRLSDDEWWRSVVEEFRTINERLDNGQIEIEANTKLTQEINTKLTPIADAWETMQGGIKVLGGIGKVGLFIAKHWYVLVGAWLFVKVFVHGDGWEAAVAAFWKGVTGK